jgi:protoporphyrinogen/coproporphyrinogen III oxidase
MNTPRIKVAIIGGGITGLTAAWVLQNSKRVDYTLLEKGNRWGGKVLTETVSGEGEDEFIVEAGPDSFLTQKPWALDLAKELGLEDHFLPTNDAQRTIYVLNKGKLVTIPDGLQLIAPTKLLPFMRSPLFSPIGKLRMGLDLVLPPRQEDEDESVAQFIGRRLGNEAVHKLAEPLLAGIYNADPYALSLMATFPRFRAMEKEHGSIIRAMLDAKRKASASESNNGKKSAMFVSFQHGTQELTDALVTKLTGDLRLDTCVKEIEALDLGYRLHLKDDSILEVDQVILAVPAYVAAQLVRPFASEAAQWLDEIRYVSTGTVSFGYRLTDIKRPLDGFGVVIPTHEKRQINAITWTSTKFTGRAPEDYALIRVFFGGTRTAALMDKSDEEILQIARTELKSIMGLDAIPVFHRIYRWHRAQPQYDVGHLERVTHIEKHLPRGIWVTGSAYRGVGLPDCIYQAKQTAQYIIETTKAEMPTM